MSQREVLRAWGEEGEATATLDRGEPLLLTAAAGYRVELLVQSADLQAAFRLRHRLFAEEWGWVPTREDGLEVDDHDAWTRMVGLFDPDRRLVGVARMHAAASTFMLEREFRDLAGPAFAWGKEIDCLELSRLGLSQEVRATYIATPFGPFDLLTLLLRGIHVWCQWHKVRRIYGVTELRLFRLLRSRGFPFEPLQEPVRMPDGVIALGIRLDWQRFHMDNQAYRPDLETWFRTPLRSGQASRPAPPTVSGSPYPAFS